ncbi:hypothetical protein JCM5350_004492 [Sporobolomyces pararoseus]
MPARQLPPELLTDIFSNLASSPSTLYRSLLVSRTFCSLVKPILYRHITITHKVQCELLQRVSNEDKRGGLGEGVIVDLLCGRLLDISAIETLHVKDVHEHEGDEGTRKGSDPRFKPASNLTELSISGHQGGGLIWKDYLRKRYIPNLKRLGYSCVSRYDARDGFVIFTEDHPIGKDLPYSQLEVLVAYYPDDDSNHPIKTFPSDNFLCLPDYFASHAFQEMDLSLKHFKFGYSETDSNGPSNWVKRIERRFENRFNTKDDVHIWLPERPLKLSPQDYQGTIDRIKAKGFAVHGYEDETAFEASTSLIFPSFVSHLKRNGKLERAREMIGSDGLNTR